MTAILSQWIMGTLVMLMCQIRTCIREHRCYYQYYILCSTTCGTNVHKQTMVVPFGAALIPMTKFKIL